MREWWTDYHRAMPQSFTDSGYYTTNSWRSDHNVLLISSVNLWLNHSCDIQNKIAQVPTFSVSNNTWNVTYKTLHNTSTFPCTPYLVRPRIFGVRWRANKFVYLCSYIVCSCMHVCGWTIDLSPLTTALWSTHTYRCLNRTSHCVVLLVFDRNEFALEA